MYPPDHGRKVHPPLHPAASTYADPDRSNSSARSERFKLKALMEQYPVVQRAYQNAYNRAMNQVRPFNKSATYAAVTAGREAATKAYNFIKKQQAKP